MIITLKSSFSSAHFYTQSQWSEEQNKKTFGRCHTPYGHGHNYVLEVGFHLPEGSNLSEKPSLQQLLQQLTERLDHEHLNFSLPEFQEAIPTTENIVLYFLEKLKTSIPEKKIAHVRLYEMDNLWTEIRL